MSAPFRDSLDAQVASLRDRVDALNLEVAALRKKPVRTPSPPSVSAFVYRVLAANAAMAWLLIGGCASFNAPTWVIVACSITGGLFVFGSVGALIARIP